MTQIDALLWGQDDPGGFRTHDLRIKSHDREIIPDSLSFSKITSLEGLAQYS